MSRDRRAPPRSSCSTTPRESPYGNPIPGLDELGEEPNEAFRLGVTSLLELAGEQPAVVVVRRIGEPAQVDHEALSLLTAAGLLPGQRVRVRRQDGRVIVVRDGAEDTAGVSLPVDVAAHVFAAAVEPATSAG